MADAEMKSLAGTPGEAIGICSLTCAATANTAQ
jgi:hypothetical protein